MQTVSLLNFYLCLLSNLSVSFYFHDYVHYLPAHLSPISVCATRVVKSVHVCLFSCSKACFLTANRDVSAEEIHQSDVQTSVAAARCLPEPQFRQTRRKKWPENKRCVVPTISAYYPPQIKFIMSLRTTYVYARQANCTFFSPWTDFGQVSSLYLQLWCEQRLWFVFTLISSVLNTEVFTHQYGPISSRSPCIHSQITCVGV